MTRPTLTRDDRRRFARAMEVRRLHPRLWHFSYWSCKNNLVAFECFLDKLSPEKRASPPMILDVGCGFKPWLQSLRERGLDSRVKFLGTDFSSDWSDADAISLADILPLASDSVDAVILSEVVEHCPHPRQVLAEALRVLRPGGLMLVTTPFVFAEHGVPYDYQRLTQYFYREVFFGQEIHTLRPSNSQFSTPFAAMNVAVDSSPIGQIPGLPVAFYLLMNLISLGIESALTALGPRLMRTWRDVSYTMPMGYAVVIEKSARLGAQDN